VPRGVAPEPVAVPVAAEPAVPVLPAVAVPAGPSRTARRSARRSCTPRVAPVVPRRSPPGPAPA